jgi:hypothetical protein
VKKIIERYLEAEQLLKQAEDVFGNSKRPPANDAETNQGTIEFLRGERNLAYGALKVAVAEAGLPSVQADLTFDALDDRKKAEERLQREANRLKRKAWLMWGQEMLVASPRPEEEGTLGFSAPPIPNRERV